MASRMRVVCGVLALQLALAVGLCAQSESETRELAPKAHVKVQLRGVDDRVEIARDAKGELCFYLFTDDGQIEVLSPTQFAERVFAEQTRQAWWHRLFNITSPLGFAWVALGFLGQLLFTGRMLVQWLASEKERRSVVPPAFWWMSLLGASMLLVYFVWRRDIVGVIGQATGWLIYSRNLWLIHRARSVDAPAITHTGPEPSGS